MTIGNVNDSPIRLNALLIENVRLSYAVLSQRIMLHYHQEFLGQLYRVLGSADFLGNPIGLFSNVSSGVADLFYEPTDNVVEFRDFGTGLARGAGSFLKKTVFGVTDSMTKVTGSIGKGLSAATLDKQFQSQRRQRQVRNKPRHALYGVAAGAGSLVTSVASGFEGLAVSANFHGGGVSLLSFLAFCSAYRWRARSLAALEASSRALAKVLLGRSCR